MRRGDQPRHLLPLTVRVVLGPWVTRLAAVLMAGLSIGAAVEIVDLANAESNAPLWRYPLRLPALFVLVSPVVMLASSAWAGAYLTRTNQLLALAASGVGGRRALRAVPWAASSYGVLVFFCAALLAPIGLSHWSITEASREPAEARWIASRDGSTLLRLTRQGDDALVFVLDERGLPLRRIEARAMERRGEQVFLHDAVITPVGQPPEPKVARLLVPGTFVVEPTVSRPPQLLTWGELHRAIVLGRSSGRDVAPYVAERGLRLALALACPITGVLGMLVGVRFGDRPLRAALAVITVGLGYWGCLSPLWALASAGLVSGTTVALGPASLLGIASLIAWWKVLG